MDRSDTRNVRRSGRTRRRVGLATAALIAAPLAIGVLPAGGAFADAAAPTVANTIDLSAGYLAPWDVVFSQDGSTAYVTDSGDGTVSVIDTATDMVTHTISLPYDSYHFQQRVPWGEALSPDGTTLYVADNRFPGGSVVPVDVSSSFTAGTPIAVDGPQGSLVFSPDGTRLYVADTSPGNVSVIDTGTNTVVETLDSSTVGDDPDALQLSPDGHTLYVTDDTNGSNAGVTVVHDVDGTSTATFTALGTSPSSLALSSDGSTLYVGDNVTHDVYVLDVSGVTPSLAQTIPATGHSGAPAVVDAMALSPDGSELYLADEWNTSGDDRGISVIDTAAAETTAFTGLPGAAAPEGVAFAPDGHAYVAAGSNTVYDLASDLGGPTVTTQPQDQSAVAGDTATFTVASSGAPAGTVRWKESTDGGATFTDIGGADSASYTTPTLTVGDDGNEYEAVVTNYYGSDTSDAATLSVVPAVTPEITSASSATFTEGQPGSFSVAGTGTMTESGTLPAGVTFTGGTGSATISGTPTQTGTFPVTLTATASGGTTDQQFTLTVTSPPPVLVSPAITSSNSATFAQGQPGSAAITGTGTITESGALPAGVTFTGGTDSATISGTPTEAGAFPITLTATASGGTTSQQFTLTVTPAPKVAPTVSLTASPAHPAHMGASVTLSVSVTGSTATPTGSVTITRNGGGSLCSVTLADGAGSCSTASLPAGASTLVAAYSGDDAYTAGSGDAQVTVGTAPKFGSRRSVRMRVGVHREFTVMATGAPSPVMTVEGLPAGLHASVRRGSVTIAGAAKHVGRYVVRLTAKNAVGMDTKALPITVVR